MAENDPKPSKPARGRVIIGRTPRVPPEWARFTRGHLEPGDVPFAVRRRWQFIAAGAALAAFLLGLLAGKFLLP